MNIPGLYINGEWMSGYGKQFVSKNPATLEDITVLAAASTSDVARAIKSARQAFDKWSNTPLDERIKKLHVYAENLKNTQKDIELAISKKRENHFGKPKMKSLR